jgi:hypothetical protein
MIHYFNPGHETAVLNASKHYQPAANQLKIQHDLAFLPAWYADPDDWVWVDEEPANAFREEICRVHAGIRTLSIDRLIDERNTLLGQGIDLWGISPQSIHRFESISRQYGLGWQIPVWTEELRRLSSRTTALHILTQLLQSIPELSGTAVPHFVSSLGELEEYLHHHPGRWLIKSPFSSSGRGLVWLALGLPARSEQQIIGGMLKKQSQVSVEPALDKVMDFSMHFEISAGQAIRFAGYSIFQTNEKGAYIGSFTATQEVLKNQIHAFIDKHLLSLVKNQLLSILQKTYSPHYNGNLGVDMLVYRTTDGAYRLHPCIEINLRKSMGYLAICLHHRYLHSQTNGRFQVDYHSSPAILQKQHSFLKQQHPIIVENNRIVSGYLNLCPITDTSAYHAYLIGGISRK